MEWLSSPALMGRAITENGVGKHKALSYLSEGLRVPKR